MREALRVGVSVGEFWAQTPRETLAAIQAAAWRAEMQARRDVALAWHTAALTRSRRMPSLKKLLGSGPARELDGQELEERRREHAAMVATADGLTGKGQHGR